MASLIEARTVKAEQQLSSHINEFDTRLNSYVDLAATKFDVTSRDMVLALAAQGNRVNEALVENARQLGVTLQSQADKVAGELQKFDETMGGRLQGVEALLTIHGDALVDRLTTRTTEATQQLEAQLGAFDERVTAQTSAITNNLGSLTARIETGLAQRGQQLNDMLVQRSMEIARTMADAGRATGDALAQRAEQITSTIEGHIDGAERPRDRAADAGLLHVRELRQRIATTLDRSTEALSTLLGERGEALVSLIQATGGQAVRQISESGGDAVRQLAQTSDDAVRQMTDTSDEAVRRIADAASGISQTIDARRDELVRDIDGKMSSLTTRLDAVTADLRTLNVDRSEQAAATLQTAATRLGTDVSGVLNRLNDANAVLNEILAAASTNLASVEQGLTERVRDLENAMGGIIADTAKTTDRVEQQVAVLQERVQRCPERVVRAVGADPEPWPDARPRGAGTGGGTGQHQRQPRCQGQPACGPRRGHGGQARGYRHPAGDLRPDAGTPSGDRRGRSRAIGSDLAQQAETTSDMVREQFEALKRIRSVSATARSWP